jgi:hypothetical protein
MGSDIALDVAGRDLAERLGISSGKKRRSAISVLRFW